MTDPEAALGALVQQALAAELGAEFATADPLIRPSAFADYQSNAAMSLARQVGRAPRDVAGPIAERLAAADAVASAEVSGPGFINIALSDSWIATQSGVQTADPRLGVAFADPSEVVVVDYSGPNVAKELHAGHLRATIVGEAVARILEHLGHDVVRAAHLGDWGTQFGQLIEHALDIGEQATYDELAAGEFTAFYQSARAKFDTDPMFADRARKRVVQLQSGEPDAMRLWKLLVDDSKKYLRKIYARLDVRLTDADMAPESFYNSMLADVNDELERQGLAVMSHGALCAFPPGFTGRDGKPVPLMLRKSDGGYGYDSTDAAAIRYRLTQLGATRLIYVVGSEQHQHLEMIFELARQAGWLMPPARAEHAVIGLMTAPGGQRLRTRSGDQIKLSDLIDEAVDRAATVIADRYDGPDPVHFRQGRPRPGDCEWPDRARHPSRTGAGPAAARVRPGRRRRGCGRGAAQASQLPVRTGERVHYVLRAVPGADSRGRDSPKQARAQCTHSAGARDRPGPPRRPCARTDVADQTRQLRQHAACALDVRLRRADPGRQCRAKGVSGPGCWSSAGTSRCKTGTKARPPPTTSRNSNNVVELQQRRGTPTAPSGPI